MLGFTVFFIVALVGIGMYMRAHRHHSICKDGRPPVSQKTDEMGGISYRCHNGQIVTPPL